MFTLQETDGKNHLRKNIKLSFLINLYLVEIRLRFRGQTFVTFNRKLIWGVFVALVCEKSWHVCLKIGLKR